MNIDFYSVWQEVAFQVVHKTTIWLLLVLFGTTLACWYLAILLDKHNAREREAKLARKTAAGYASAAIVLWLFSWLMG